MPHGARLSPRALLRSSCRAPAVHPRALAPCAHRPTKTPRPRPHVAPFLGLSETTKLLADSSRPWPTGFDGLRDAAARARRAGRLVVECDALTAAPEFTDDGGDAAPRWRDDAA